MPSYTRIGKGRARRQARVRKRVQGSPERPRLSVFRSARHIYAQIIDDESGRTLAAASTLDGGIAGALDTLEQEIKKAIEEAEAAGDKGGKKKGKKPQLPDTRTKVKQARAVGRLVAQKAAASGLKQVVFDRNGFLYHGRIKAVADGAREGGLDF